MIADYFRKFTNMATPASKAREISRLTKNLAPQLTALAPDRAVTLLRNLDGLSRENRKVSNTTTHVCSHTKISLRRPMVTQVIRIAGEVLATEDAVAELITASAGLIGASGSAPSGVIYDADGALQAQIKGRLLTHIKCRVDVFAANSHATVLGETNFTEFARQLKSQIEEGMTLRVVNTSDTDDPQLNDTPLSRFIGDEYTEVTEEGIDFSMEDSKIILKVGAAGTALVMAPAVSMDVVVQIAFQAIFDDLD